MSANAGRACFCNATVEVCPIPLKWRNLPENHWSLPSTGKTSAIEAFAVCGIYVVLFVTVLPMAIAQVVERTHINGFGRSGLVWDVQVLLCSKARRLGTFPPSLAELRRYGDVFAPILLHSDPTVQERSPAFKVKQFVVR
ncbi:hypothetical protein BU15DRAFT_62714 [Melanogaster broomeanus]|nr:hypothetical protein BU15DRAFT_62714 [Melanogaster broomeanus]